MWGRKRRSNYSNKVLLVANCFAKYKLVIGRGFKATNTKKVKLMEPKSTISFRRNDFTKYHKTTKGFLKYINANQFLPFVVTVVGTL